MPAVVLKSDFPDLLFAAVLVWMAKAAALLGARHGIHFSIACALFVFALNIAAVSVLFKQQSVTWRRFLLKIMLFCLIQALPLLPDLYSLFYLEQGNAAWLWTLGAFSAGTLFICALRMPMCFLLRNRLSESSTFRRSALCVVGLVMTHLCEALALAAAPPLYMLAFALPVVLPENQTERIPSSDNVVILVDPMISQSRRIDISHGQNVALREAAQTIAINLRLRLHREHLQKLVMILPETTFYLTQQKFNYLFMSLVDSVASEFQASEFELYVGAMNEATNLVYYGGADFSKHLQKTGVLKIKQSLVPFFEKRVFGLGTRDISAEEDTAPSVESSFAPLEMAFPAANLKICYEALTISGWRSAKPVIVLTNHSLFSRFHLLSGLYDLTLRILATINRSELIMVGNYGTTGAFFDPPGASLAHIPLHDWSFVDLPVSGGL